MPISKKIIEQINSLEVDNDFKELMIAILNEEDKGNHRFKETYERLVKEYLQKKEGDSDDQN